MRILVIGGTKFVGRHAVEEALRRGHEVTVFHRGQTQCEFSSSVSEIIGDRNVDLSVAAGSSFDAVLDTCAYRPAQVRATEALRAIAQHYTLISTISVYAHPFPAVVDEGSPLASVPDDETVDITWETYGGLKVGCEQATISVWGDDAWIVRPGFIVGPFDPTDRFTYWALKATSGERFVAPERMSSPFQFIDARDLASLVLNGIEQRARGVVNAVGGRRNYRFSDFCADLDAKPVSLPDPEGVQWPMIMPEEAEPLGLIQPSAAEALGLRDRSVAETVRDTVAWRKTESRPLTVGIPEDQERELLA